MKWAIERRVYPLLRPLKAAHGILRKRETLLLRLESDGQTGWGEAAPIESYDGQSLETCDSALRTVLPILARLEPTDPDVLVRELDRDLPSPARAAIDTAALDLAARLNQQPLWQSLGGNSGGPVGCSALITSADPIGAAEQAQAFANAGFRTLKVKVGLTVDEAVVGAIRGAIGDSIEIRLDANGAWSEREAAAKLAQLSHFHPQLCEQPVADLAAMRSIRSKSDVQISIDESATDSGALDAPLAADAVCLKLQAWGGIDRLIAAATKARSAGLLVYLGSTLEGPISIAAALHAAAVIQPDLDSGLATLDVFEGYDNVLQLSGGQIELSNAPGLGLAPDGAAC